MTSGGLSSGSSRRPGRVFVAFSDPPQRLLVLSRPPAQARPTLARRRAGSASQPPRGPLASEGPVPGSRARTSFSWSSSPRGPARGHRVASPAPRSGGGGSASGLSLRRESGEEEVSLKSGTWCGYRGGGGPGCPPPAPLPPAPSGHAGMLSPPGASPRNSAVAAWVQASFLAVAVIPTVDADKDCVCVLGGGVPSICGLCALFAFVCAARGWVLVGGVGGQEHGLSCRGSLFTPPRPIRRNWPLAVGCIWSFCLFPRQCWLIGSTRVPEVEEG